SSSFARALNYEYADGVDYRGLTALTSLSMAVSDGYLFSKRSAVFLVLWDWRCGYFRISSYRFIQLRMVAAGAVGFLVCDGEPLWQIV
ncbi:hypothetical protein, partial [Solemya pervernicosa gill symbiont]|uniref:hypothetical protein n=1 Tax=Solemya pervernicosa gill symbiont TaxID=642797 RepID=UPI001F33885F